MGEVSEKRITDYQPTVIMPGSDITIVGSSFSTKLAIDASQELERNSISTEVIDLRSLNPFKPKEIIESVRKTGHLVVIDGGTKTSSFSAEVIASVTENLEPEFLKSSPKRVTLPDSPAPTSIKLEEIYYPTVENVVAAATSSLV